MLRRRGHATAQTCRARSPAASSSPSPTATCCGCGRATNYRDGLGASGATPPTGAWGERRGCCARRTSSAATSTPAPPTARSPRSPSATTAATPRTRRRPPPARSGRPTRVTWSSYALEGEAYEEPGISPDGINAVWPQHGGYVTRTAAGFAAHTLDTEGQEYTVTATITDAAQVSYLYGGHVRPAVRASSCSPAPATPSRRARSSSSPARAGTATSPTSTRHASGSATRRLPPHRTVISRADAASPWAVTAIAPGRRPGPRADRGDELDQRFFTAPGLPLLALGSRDGRRVLRPGLRPGRADLGPAGHGVRRRHGGATWGDNWTSEPLAVLVADLRCGRGATWSPSPPRDGTSWQALRMGRAPARHLPRRPLRRRARAHRTYVISPRARRRDACPGG